jgi:hypothetical protein
MRLDYARFSHWLVFCALTCEKQMGHLHADQVYEGHLVQILSKQAMVSMEFFQAAKSKIMQSIGNEERISV